MRYIFDIQGLQTSSKFRGIGTYTFHLVKNLIRELNTDDEIFFLIKGSLRDENDNFYIKNLVNHTKKENILEFYPPSFELPNLYFDSNESIVSKQLREVVIENANPDVVIICSLFEFDAISCIPKKEKRNYLCGVILYDLNP